MRHLQNTVVFLCSFFIGLLYPCHNCDASQLHASKIRELTTYTTNYIAPLKKNDFFLFSIEFIVLISCIILAYMLMSMRKNRRQIAQWKHKQEEYKAITSQTLLAIAKTIDAKDPCTNGHSQRVAYYSSEIAKRMHMSEEEIERVHYIALLHDIGKIGIPDTILTKPTPLTPEEYSVIQQHPIIGGQILKDITHVKDIVVGAEYHHEKFDGTGYPNGLKGDDIPFIARIIGVADSYDTMASNRPYRNGLPSDKIIDELQRCSGTQFDPTLVPIMIDIINASQYPLTTPNQ